MAQKTLNELFDSFLSREPLFISKEALQETYTPETVPHREEQIKQLASILVHTLRGEKPSNVFIYGKTGTGKTLASKFVCQELERRAQERGINLKTFYLNCKMEKTNTPYRILAHFLTQLGESVPMTGLPTEEIYKKFVRKLSGLNSICILLLDEIDALTDTSTLYDLTRINTQLQNTRVSILGISNNISFTNNLDPRIKSSLSEEELVFPPYNAIQLTEILSKRAEISLRFGVLADGVIERCAALAAQEHGDARRALDLLRVAVELAERQGNEKVEMSHVDIAQRKLDMDRVVEVIKTQPRQSQLVMSSILSLKGDNDNEASTGEVYEAYVKLCKKYNLLPPLTPRRVSDLISELEMLGLIDTSIVSRGRHGRTRAINLNITDNILVKSKEVLACELA